MNARVTVLGCGTSTGVPSIGCTDPVCLSDDPKNQRLRPSIVIESAGGNLLVDTSPDLRQQALRHKLLRVDAVIYTHYHADHTNGIDDLRMYNFLMKKSIPCYALPDTAKILRQNFSYIFGADDGYEGWKPQLELTEVNVSPFEAAGITVSPFELDHGRNTQVMGLRIGNFAYATDCNAIPEAAMAALEGVEILILDALRHRPHPTHLTVGQALEMVKAIGPRRCYFTHTNYELEYHETNRSLPEGVELAYDGLSFDITL